MASIRQQGDAFEIRECESSEAGPRQRALTRFRRILTPEVLDRAAVAARKPFDREALIQRARARGIPVAEARRETGARSLLGFLRRGGQLDPLVVALLREALTSMEARATPSHLADVVDWVGQSESARGRALRGLVRTASRIARSRSAVRSAPLEPFPRFSSRLETS
jgi:hypothetical protein